MCSVYLDEDIPQSRLPSVIEVKAGVKAKEDDKKKRYKNELTIRETSLLICYHKH